MRRFIFFLVLIFPSGVFSQTFEGAYRAVFFNLFSEQKTIVAEFAVKADNSLGGQLKIGETVKTFSGTVDKKGRFEALIEQNGNYAYKIKGKFGKPNKISLVQRNQSGSGLNKSVSESATEGNFSKVKTETVQSVSNNSATVDQTLSASIGGDKNLLKIAHDDPMFGNVWTDFAATVSFGNSNKTPIGSEAKKITDAPDASDYFVLRVKSKIDGQQSLTINVPMNLEPDKKIWRQNELRTMSYREAKGDRKNTYLSNGSRQTGALYDAGRIEIVSETETRMIFKLTNFKIKKLTKEELVTIDGVIYADK